MKITKLNILPVLGALGLLGAGSASATIIGFAGDQGSNADIYLSNGLWSRATADVLGITVSNGTTPNVEIAFDTAWDYHNSANFDVIENFTSGGAWDLDGAGDPADIAQADGRDITFTVDPGFALVLNSFDFGLTRETLNQTNTWTISLTDLGTSSVVWSQTVTYLNLGSGDITTIAPAFTGTDGTDYLLHFNLDAEGAGQNFGGGRNALDNLSFNQVAIPEPSSAALLALGSLGLLARRRK